MICGYGFLNMANYPMFRRLVCAIDNIAKAFVGPIKRPSGVG
jgi:hypothetical protein